jgi:hypothetical protein
MKGSDLANCRLRASRAFVLLGFDELGPAEQGRLATLRDDPDFFGLLKPVNALLPPKSVTNTAALLFLTLQVPRRVPTLLASLFGEELGPIHGLLADGVLEVEHAGAFVSGTKALSLLSTSAATASVSHSVSRLSLDAIECAASYEGLDATVLAQKIYAYGRQPCTEGVRRRFAKDSDLLSFLAVDPAVDDLLTSNWVRDTAAESAWISWSAGRSTARLGHKLYLSAKVDGFPHLFAMGVRALKRARCDHFKIGRRGEGVCRPDKMVAYFASLDQLRECSALIEADLRPTDVFPALAHGVPFTCAVDAAGFLSWGMDPPKLAHADEATPFQSWRQWVAWRVAIAVLSAKSAGSELGIVPFVLQRLELDGIDPSTWAPTLAIWRPHADSPGDVA